LHSGQALKPCPNSKSILIEYFTSPSRDFCFFWKEKFLNSLLHFLKAMTRANFIFLISLFSKNANNIASVRKINWTTMSGKVQMVNLWTSKVGYGNEETNASISITIASKSHKMGKGKNLINYISTLWIQLRSCFFLPIIKCG
jgi:hypothetical protein